MKQMVRISDKMRRINELLILNYAGPLACISESGENVTVEVARKDIAEVVAILKTGFRDVVDIRKAYLMIDDLHDFILVKPMVSESPVLMQDGLCVTSVEKRLVDIASDKEFAGLSDSEIQAEYQKAFESYELSVPKLLRYASRKGEKEQVGQRVVAINYRRVKIMSDIRRILMDTPITDAWIFGSFSRMEESPESDIDILFSYDKSCKFSILDHIGVKNKLEEALGRSVDLVADGSLLPFAAKSALKDRYKIYERN